MALNVGSALASSPFRNTEPPRATQSASEAIPESAHGPVPSDTQYTSAASSTVSRTGCVFMEMSAPREVSAPINESHAPGPPPCSVSNRIRRSERSAEGVTSESEPEPESCARLSIRGPDIRESTAVTDSDAGSSERESARAAWAARSRADQSRGLPPSFRSVRAMSATWPVRSVSTTEAGASAASGGTCPVALSGKWSVASSGSSDSIVSVPRRTPPPPA